MGSERDALGWAIRRLLGVPRPGRASNRTGIDRLWKIVAGSGDRVSGNAVAAGTDEIAGMSRRLISDEAKRLDSGSPERTPPQSREVSFPGNDTRLDSRERSCSRELWRFEVLFGQRREEAGPSSS
jgi:hypothetical protein